jgi:hypothetical protein
MIWPKHVLRRGALALAVAFQATAAVDILGLHTCPHHSLLPVAASGAAGAVAGGGAQGVADSARLADNPEVHGHHAATPAAGDHRATSAEQPASHEGHGPDGAPCTCVGTCQAGAGSAINLAARPTFAQEPVLATVALTTFRADEVLPSPPPFLLPFSQAPPSIA